MSAPTPSQNQAFQDGQLQYGSFIASVYRGQPAPGTLVGVFIFEGATVSRPNKRIDRPDEIGGANGFVLVNAQTEGSCVVQMGDIATPRPLNGDWFTYTFDSQIGAEVFVLGNSSDPREMQSYFKGNYSLQKATFSNTVTPLFTPA